MDPFKNKLYLRELCTIKEQKKKSKNKFLNLYTKNPIFNA